MESNETDSPHVDPDAATFESAPAAIPATAPTEIENEPIAPPPSVAVTADAPPVPANPKSNAKSTEKQEKKAKESERKQLLSSVKINASSFPMVELVA
ncbi:MAG: hypothetical protein ACAI35_14975, partial [Candidatus Methylacidiphilales bacterium]